MTIGASVPSTFRRLHADTVFALFVIFKIEWNGSNPLFFGIFFVPGCILVFIIIIFKNCSMFTSRTSSHFGFKSTNIFCLNLHLRNFLIFRQLLCSKSSPLRNIPTFERALRHHSELATFHIALSPPHVDNMSVDSVFYWCTGLGL